jgi:uncharacterized protein with FMN-binding domain
VDKATQQPISGVGITVYNASGNYANSALTNVAGNYALSGLAPGIYFARADGPNGYLSSLFDGISCNNCIPTTGTPITIITGIIKSGINFQLSQGGIISGHVTSKATHAPLTGISIGIYNSQGNYFGNTMTNAQGSYRVIGLQTGVYYATASAYDYIGRLYNDIPCQNCSVTS